MPILKYTQETMPSSEQFSKDLAQAISDANPVDDLLELSDLLKEFEEQYGMDSAQFYLQYQAGRLDDELQHCMEWAAIYDTYLRTRRLLESALLRPVVAGQKVKLAA